MSIICKHKFESSGKSFMKNILRKIQENGHEDITFFLTLSVLLTLSIHQDPLISSILSRTFLALTPIFSGT